jgi:hypothetical protein
MCPFLTISLSIYYSRVEYSFAVKKCDHITQGPAYLTLTTIFESKKTGGTLWLLMLGEGVLVPSPKFWVQKSRWPIWKSKLAWFSKSIATSVPVILTTRGQQSAPSQLPLWGKSKLWLMESNLRPLHIWDWEPVTIPLSSTHWWKRRSRSTLSSHYAWRTNGVCECKMDVLSTWIPTWHRLDHVSWSLGLFFNNHLRSSQRMLRLVSKMGTKLLLQIVSEEMFGPNQSTSSCFFQDQLVTRGHLSVFLYWIEAWYSLLNSSKTTDNSFPWSRELQPVNISQTQSVHL